MAGPAGLRVDVGFGLDPFDVVDITGALYTDVTDDTYQVDVSSSSRSSRFDTFAAGRCRIVLDNSTRTYDSAYAAGTHYGDFLRHVPVRIMHNVGSGVTLSWFGFVRNWRTEYAGRYQSVTVLECVDLLGVLARYDLAPITAAYAGDTPQERIDRVLDDIGWPDFGATTRAYNGGASSTLGATTFGTNALAHLADLSRGDGGMIYANGYALTYDDRTAPALVTRMSTSQDSWDDTTSPAYTGLEVSGTGEGYRDVVRVSGITGNVQEVDNSASNAAPVSLQLTGTLIESDSAALAAAQFYADLYGTDTAHPTKVTFTVAAGGDNIEPDVLARQVRDRVDVTYSPPGGGADITADCFVDGIRHKITPARWDTEFLLSSADAFDALDGPPSTWLVVGDATLGKVGTGTVAY